MLAQSNRRRMLQHVVHLFDTYPVTRPETLVPKFSTTDTAADGAASSYSAPCAYLCCEIRHAGDRTASPATPSRLHACCTVRPTTDGQASSQFIASTGKSDWRSRCRHQFRGTIGTMPFLKAKEQCTGFLERMCCVLATFLA